MNGRKAVFGLSLVALGALLMARSLHIYTFTFGELFRAFLPILFMGAAMFAPDYTQWHGFFEVADRFYMEFLPQVREAVEHGKTAGGEKAKAAEEVEKMIEDVLNDDNHKWFTGNEPEEVKAARKKAAEEFKKRYAN